jgi:RNA polymerase sigma-70 factor (ECF subfamily)
MPADEDQKQHEPSTSLAAGVGTGEFVQLIAAHQKMLTGYIRTLVFDPAATDDILQETNLVLWQKAGEFERGTNFVAWACRIAYHRVRAYWRDQSRERTYAMDPALLANIAAEAAHHAEQMEARIEALRGCLAKLTQEQQRLMAMRYAPGGSVSGMASSSGRSAASLSVTLTRIRKRLIDCVNFTLAKHPGAL